MPRNLLFTLTFAFGGSLLEHVILPDVDRVSTRDKSWFFVCAVVVLPVVSQKVPFACLAATSPVAAPPPPPVITVAAVAAPPIVGLLPASVTSIPLSVTSVPLSVTSVPLSRCQLPGATAVYTATDGSKETTQRLGRWASPAFSPRAFRQRRSFVSLRPGGQSSRACLLCSERPPGWVEAGHS